MFARAVLAIVSIIGAVAPTAQLAQTGAIVVSVSDWRRDPVPGAIVAVRPTRPGLLRSGSTQGAEGRIRFDTLPAGTYRVTTALNGFDPVRSDVLSVFPGQTVEYRATLEIGIVCECIEFPPGPTGLIAGRVVDSEGYGLPLAKVTVVAEGMTRGASGYADEAGRYRAKLAPGKYSLTFSYPGFDTLRREVIEMMRDRTEVVDARLTPARDADSSPGARLSLGCDCPGNVFDRPVREDR